MQETILPKDVDSSVDTIEVTLQNISQNILVFIFGLLPLFFIPIVVVPLGYIKTIFVIVGVLLAIIFFSLTVLRSGKMSIRVPLAFFVLWIYAFGATLSALLSGDRRDSFLGDDFGVHTGLFIVLMTLVATIVPLIGHSKVTIMRLYILLTGSAFVLGIFHIIRMFVGADVLSLKLFTTLSSTPVGGWNDLALFFGLSVLLSLVALEQLPLTRWGKSLFIAVVAIALCMLAIVNFFAVWVVLGFVSLVVLMYSLTKDRFAEKTLTLEGKKNTVSMQSILLSMCVFTVSVVFIIGGGAVGGYISQITGITYLEVRPSFGATVDIARSVYHENALMGIGPNKFIDAWRLYKDPSINQTVFWATDFASGSGYVTTLFITTGVLGVVTWILFFCLFIYAGFKMLFKSAHADRFWYFIGTSSFVGALYLWGMACLYAPGSVILLLAALFTGITFTSYGALISTRSFSLSISSNKRAGFMLVGVVMVIIIGASSGLYYVGQQYVSVYSYGVALQKLQKGSDSKNAEQEIANAYATSNNEVYALQLASYQLAKINAYSSLEKLSTEQQQDLDDSVRNGINAARIAVAKDATDSAAWSTLGSILSVLAGVKVEGTKDGASEAFAKARSFDPQNPVYQLLEAQLASRTGDLVLARAKIEEAIKLKPNYAEALLFMSQIDIAEGKTENAIATTRAIISIEPENPARYYQLGVLELVQNKLDEAIAAFSKAIELNANYANARYQLALALAQKGDTKNAVEQLKVVLELNPGNTDLISLISRLESGESVEKIFAPSGAPQVQEPTAVTEVNDTVTTTQKPDTNLVSPVNTVSAETPADEVDDTSTTEAQ